MNSTRLTRRRRQAPRAPVAPARPARSCSASQSRAIGPRGRRARPTSQSPRPRCRPAELKLREVRRRARCPAPNIGVKHSNDGAKCATPRPVACSGLSSPVNLAKAATSSRVKIRVMWPTSPTLRNTMPRDEEQRPRDARETRTDDRAIAIVAMCGARHGALPFSRASLHRRSVAGS